MRKIPKIMFTQHPDNAFAPYWGTNPLIGTHQETEECFRLFSDFGLHEYMWDWEGKLVDENVIEKFLGKYRHFFLKHNVGKDVFLTFRIPNPKAESSFRLGKAFMVILAAESIAKKLGVHSPPLFEVILPLTESADDLMAIKRMFRSIANTMTGSFQTAKTKLKDLEMIPLFESVDTIMKSRRILEEYLGKSKVEGDNSIKYIRPFVARSDPALNSGIVATTLSIKWALSEFAKFSKDNGVKTFPIIGPGALSFRGGFTPFTASEFMAEFAGVRTILIQSSFRYDYPLKNVKISLEKIVRNINSYKPTILAKSDKKLIQSIIKAFERPYKKRVEEMSPLINQIAKYIPKRRERVQHIGLFGYSRSVGNYQLPRAIGFTASCYSLGIPPEFFGIAPGLSTCRKIGKLQNLRKYFSSFSPLLTRAGRFLRKSSITELKIDGFMEEIDLIEHYLDTKLGPVTDNEHKHAQLVESIIQKLLTKEDPSSEILEAARIRKSIG